MKIFFYSSVFAPSVGGIEKVVETLCREFVRLGHEVVVVTQTPGSADVPFAVERNPGFSRFAALLRWCDVHVQANVSLKAAWGWVIVPRRWLYNHQGVYQRDDGTMRWIDHTKTIWAKRLPGIANSQYTAERTGSKWVIGNAYDDSVFGNGTSSQKMDQELVFLGRLVSQKGADCLLEALVHLSKRGFHPRLTVIGDGPERDRLEADAHEGLRPGQVRFAGVLQGRELAEELQRHRVMVVPSRYEEPFGIVALEGLASGCIPVVSERGGLVDAIGGHGFTFPNGDAQALASTLEEVFRNPAAAQERLVGVQEHLERHTARAVAEHYLQAFEEHLRGK